MSKETNDSGVSNERNTDGPDYFGFYKCQIAEILSQDDDFSIFEAKLNKSVGTEHGCEVSDSLFTNGIGTSLSDFKRERLRAVLRQSVTVLSAEVDKMFSPVMKTSELQMQRRDKMHLLRVNGSEESKEGTEQTRKKLKVAADPTTGVSPKSSAYLLDGEMDLETTSQEQPKVDDEMQALLEDDNSELDKIMTKFSDELSTKLGYMEQQLEELLDAVMSKCRLMTLAERKQLQKMIKGLPRKNLERIAELVERNKPIEQRSPAEIFVNLEKESNITLWRMYYYVEAVEKAKQLCT